MANKRLLAFIIPLGIVAAAIAASPIIAPGSRLFTAPSSLFWVALAILVAVIPVRRLMGTQHVNLGSLVMLTVLLLYGTGAAVLTAWAVGIASVASSRSGNLRSDIERAMLGSGKYVVSMGAAGILLWGTACNGGALDYGLGKETIPGLLAAYGLYLGIKWMIGVVAIGLRDNMRLREVRLPPFDRESIFAWVIPPAAYLLALAYLNSGVLTITMLVSVLLVQGLTVGEDRHSRSSWVRLTDGLRQACDGHVMRHRGETQRVVEIATAIGRKMKLPPANLRLLGHAAALHNVGYIALDSRLVLRPGKLTPEDISAIRQHPECSRRILSEVAGMADVAEVVRCHHENPDGKGYPRGLGGDVIPIEAAIVKSVEAFVAMTSPREYRGKTLSRDQALEEIAAATGHTFDPIAAYYLFETVGRSDLASQVSRHFGLPEKRAIRARLSKPKLGAGSIAAGPVRRSIAAGLALLAAALGTTVLLNRLGIAKPIEAHPIWFTMNAPGAAFLMSLLGLAVLKPGRLAWGAYCSWASAVVLAMVLAGGPIYIPISGMAFIGWALVLRPGPTGSIRRDRTGSPGGDRCEQEPPDTAGNKGGAGRDSIRVKTHKMHAYRAHHRIMARIDRSNRVRGDLGATSYGLVLMVAGACAWVACRLGYQAWKGSLIGLILSPLLMGVLSTGVFYMVETLLQAALLAKGGLSPIRVWYRNYANAFPEPLTYAILGYGIYIVSGLLGLWTAMLVFALPILWRQGVLENRIRTLRTTSDLVRSIAKAVDLKNAPGGTHASVVAATAVAIARQMGKGEPFVEEVENAAILHDIGKASWPNKALILRIPWDSKEERYRYIHPDMSAEIATWAGYSEVATGMIRSHHEHYDGSGYMRGLKGGQIPVGARILCVADSFANMIHGEDPRFGRTLAETVREIRFGSAKQFDPEVVRALMGVLEGAVFGETEKPEHGAPTRTPEEIGAEA